jgi:C_GCAxxG_C_C family probable redox protein
MSEQASQRSLELFRSGYFCAESVLMAIAEYKGIQSDLIPKIATGFCSGVSRTGNICGAVSGAIMGIKLVTGRTAPSDSVELSYSLTQKLISLFEQQHETINCSKLIGCNLNSEQGQSYFLENNLMDRCQQYAVDATRIVISLLTEQDLS